MNKKSFWSMMAILMIAMLSISLASCGSDDDNNEDGSFLVGEWYECDSKGVLRNDATEEEVYHLRLRANGTGDFWSVSKGKEDAYKYSVEYSSNIKGTSGKLTLTITSSTDASEIGKIESGDVTFENGILSAGKIYYTKKYLDWYRIISKKYS